MSIDKYEKDILARNDNTSIRRKNVTHWAEETFSDICYHIAEARIRIKTGKTIHSACGSDGFDPIIELTGRNKVTNHAIEFLVKVNHVDYLKETKSHTFCDKLFGGINEGGGYRSSHSEFSSTDEWLWFTQRFDELMKTEGIHYRWFYASEELRKYRQPPFDLEEILHKGKDYVELPSTGVISFSVANKGIRGDLFIHLWCDV